FTACFSRQRDKKVAAEMPINLQDLPVLVVDDNATNRGILEEILLSWHMQPTTAASSQEALTAMNQPSVVGKPFSLALIDARIPETDGLALADRIRRDQNLANSAIIMLISAGQSRQAARARQQGVAAYLTKPVKQSDLLDTIFSVLSITSDDEMTVRRRPSSPSKGRRGCRILLAEDNPV